MAIVQLNETQWHGNPRPIASYHSTVYDDAVSPIQYKYITTSVPLATLTPTATIDVAGPAPLVEFTLGGVWPELTSLDITITRTDGVNGDFTTTLFSPALQGPIDAANGIAEVINAEPDLTANNDGEKVIVSALAPVTALTITVLTVN